MLKSYVLVLRTVRDGEISHRISGELQGASDRAAAIVGASLVDESLTDALRTMLHQHSKTLARLFDQPGPIGTFSAKIDLGLAIGAYGERLHSDLDTIRRIRNRFAHNLSVGSFADQTCRDLAMNLRMVERYTYEPGSERPPVGAKIGVQERDRALADPRDRYLLTVSVALWCLSIPGKVMMPKPEH